MPCYRLYFLDGEGHITHREECDLAGDEAAIARARALDHEQGIEIWQGSRKVSLVTAAPPGLIRRPASRPFQREIRRKTMR